MFQEFFAQHHSEVPALPPILLVFFLLDSWNLLHVELRLIHKAILPHCPQLSIAKFYLSSTFFLELQLKILIIFYLLL